MSKQRVLVLSFSKLQSDARILKQIRALADDFDVSTCGEGPSPDPRVTHFEIGRGVSTVSDLQQALLLRLKLWERAYWRNPQAREAVAKLKGKKFDLVIANDLDTVGVAQKIASPEQIHCDLHEYFLGLYDNVPAWTKLRKPFHSALLKKWVSRVASVTTVNQTIAERYQSEFGFQCGVVTNASPLTKLEPQTVSDPIRLVHSGGAQPSRKIEVMMRAVAAAESTATLDLFLVGTGTAYYASLVELAEELGPRINIRQPLPYSELVQTLNQYDAGVQVLAPTSTNNAIALPNKFFDYVQARLGLVIGPTPPMKELLDSYQLGTVTDDFSEDALRRAVEDLTPERIWGWKQNADAAAPDLSSEAQLDGWLQPFKKILARAPQTEKG